MKIMLQILMAGAGILPSIAYATKTDSCIATVSGKAPKGAATLQNPPAEKLELEQDYAHNYKKESDKEKKSSIACKLNCPKCIGSS